MKQHRTLWGTVGPVIVAIAAILLLLILPHKHTAYRSVELQKASISLSTNVFKGESMKTHALDHGYVPFFGSSELARLDLMHPSVLAEKYHRSYKPFLLGKAGTQSLTHYFAMQDMTKQLRNKKAVFIISPQWFTKVGQLKAAFSIYYSPLATAQWLLKAHNNFVDRYAAKRLLTMQAVSATSIMGQAIEAVAHGHHLTHAQRVYLQLRLRTLHSEDKLFAGLGIQNKLSRLKKDKKKLPKRYAFNRLDHLAGRIGRRSTTSNPFQIDNYLYRSRLKGKRIKAMKNKQVKLDYRRSPEYADFELILNQFAQSHTNVLFIMPPINAKWAKYTGLSMRMLKQTNRKIKQQLTRQGFNNVLDLTQAGNVNYFMQDTIHLGWRGWLAIDQVVRPFIERQQKSPHYHMKQMYFSKKWQQKIVK